MGSRRILVAFLALSLSGGMFAAGKYDVIVNLTGNADGTKPVPVKQYEAGKKVTLTVTPVKGYRVTQWSSGLSFYSGGGNKLTFTMPDGPVTYSANIDHDNVDARRLADMTPEFKLVTNLSTEASKTDGVVMARVGGFVRTIYYVPMLKTSKLTAKFEGLPKGLKVTTTNFLAAAGTHGEMCAYPAWMIEGVPTESVDIGKAPVIAILSNEGGHHVENALPMSIEGKSINVSVIEGAALDGVDLGLPATDARSTAWLPKSGVPAGCKADKTTGALTGTPAPGIYPIVHSRVKTIGKTKYTETCTVTLKVTSKGINRAFFGNIPNSWNAVLGVANTWDFAPFLINVTSPKLTGLPAGLKFDAKTLKVTGKPTKLGTSAVALAGKSADGSIKTHTIFWDVNLPVEHSGVLADAGFGDLFDFYKSTYVGQQINEMDLFFAVQGAKVTASGLPAGVKLVKTGTRTVNLGGRWTSVDAYEYQGIPTTAKITMTTVKVSVNGKTETYRFPFNVRPFTAPGTLYGRFYPESSAAVGPLLAGEVSLVIAQNGTAKAVFSDGKEKLTVNFKGYTGCPARTDDSDMFDGSVMYTAVIPATKTVPERIVRFSVDSRAVPNDLTKGHSVVLSAPREGCLIGSDADPGLDRRILLAPRWESSHHDLNSDEYAGVCPHEDVFIMENYSTGAFFANNKANTESTGGYVYLLRDKMVASSQAYTGKVSGRTPDGLAFSNKTVTYCYDDLEQVRQWFWSPFTVYNKATGTTWIFTCDHGRARVDSVGEATGYVADCYNHDGEGPLVGTYKADVALAAGSVYKTFPDAVNRVFDGQKTGIFDAGITVYWHGQVLDMPRSLGFGVKGADITVTYKNTTGVTTFKDNVWTYEIVPCGPTAGVFHGIRYGKEGSETVYQPVKVTILQ